MSQHLLSLGDDQVAIIDRALADLEMQLAPPATFDEYPPVGLERQPIPASGRPGARAELAALDPMRGRLQRLQRLIQYARDAEIILVDGALNRCLGQALSKGSGERPGPQALLERPPIEVA